MKQIKLLLIPAILVYSTGSYAQNVGINADGSAPDNTAMLDIKSDAKGLLVPRMSEANRLAISSPAPGLLVYQTDQGIGFYYFEATSLSWKYIDADAATGPAGGDLSGFYPNPSIANAAVTGIKIQNNAVGNTHIVDNAVTTTKIADAAVTGIKIQNNAVGNTHILDNAVTTTKIADAAVTGVKIQNNAIGNTHIANGTLAPAKISTTGASSGEVLGYNGTNILWTNPPEFTLPYAQSMATPATLFAITQTGTGNPANFTITNAANTATVTNLSTTGIGVGLAVQLTNPGSGARGIDVSTSGVGTGVFATSVAGHGVWGIASNISAAGVIGDNTFGEAVVGRNRGGNGVGAVVGRNDSAGYGVRGFNTKTGIGVLGQSGISGGTGVGGRFENVNAANSSDALQAATNGSGNALRATNSGSGNAAQFTGNVVVTGNLTVSGNVAKGGGSFMIDHPLDPKNKILYHSFVESPDMKNIYDGVTILNNKGESTIQLPQWFQEVNGNFRYLLTPIGAPAPGLYIAEEVSNNRFRVAGGTPGMKVSWQVTGIRHDPYARKHPIVAEVNKTANERGTYIHPDAYEQVVAPVSQKAILKAPISLPSGVASEKVK